MGIQDRDWYHEERRRKEREQQANAWSHLQQSGEKRKRWNRRMPRPSEIRHRSHVPGWTAERQENAPSWKTLFYWSACLNVLMIGTVFYLM